MGECCLYEGTYTLTCADSANDGWHGGFINIAGTEYCGDFTGWGADSTTRTVEIGSCVEDACGVCDGDSSSCLDACGVPNGSSDTCLDACGVPNGASDTCGCVVETVDIWVQNYGDEMEWTIASCSGGPYAGGSADEVSYTETCCLGEGTFTLTCTDAYGDGWHGGYITIAGTDYCSDFVGWGADSTTRTVELGSSSSAGELSVIESSIVTLSTNEPLSDVAKDLAKEGYCVALAAALDMQVTCAIEEVVSRRRLLSQTYDYLMSGWASEDDQDTMTELPVTFVDGVAATLEATGLEVTLESTPDAAPTPPPTPPEDDGSCDADFDGSGSIGVQDLLEFLVVFGNTCDGSPGCTGDLDASGAVTVDDLLMFLAVFGESCD